MSTAGNLNNNNDCANKTTQANANVVSNTSATSNTKTSITSTNSNNSTSQIMDNISNNVNPKTMQEGIQLINKPDELIARLQSGADQFQAQTGRQMTYSEMRQMFG